MSNNNGITVMSFNPGDELDHEMLSVFNIFSRAANAIVEASRFAKQLEAQGREIAELREAWQIVTEAKAALETNLATTIAERDYNIRLAQDHAATIESERQELQRTCDELASTKFTLAQVSQQLADTEATADYFRNELVKAESQRDEAITTLAKLKAVLGIPEPKPEPKPVEPAPAEPAQQEEPKPAPTFPESYYAPPREANYLDAPTTSEVTTQVEPSDWHPATINTFE